MRTLYNNNRNQSKLATVATMTLCTLLITSCGGSSSSDSVMDDGAGGATTGASDAGAGTTSGGTGGATSGGGLAQGPMMGRVNITRVTNFTLVTADFHQYSNGLTLTLDDVLSAIEQPVGTCRVSPYLTSDIPDLEVLEEFFDRESRDAGEVITITSPAGTWLSLTRGGDADFVTYQAEVADGAALTPVPDGLTIDIPGADYPAFANVPVGDVAELTGVSMDDNGQLTWDEGSADNEIELALGTITPTFEANYTYCRLADTGSFELPASVQAAIAGAEDYEYALTRLATTVVRQGNTAFAVISRSAQRN